MKPGHSILITMAMLFPLAVSADDVDIRISIGNAPPPPVIVVREEPRMYVVPGSTVYVVNDQRIGYDTFRYGVYWYVYRDGWWYRASRHHGPYRAIEVRYVPRDILVVPAKHWKHHPHGGPPGQVKKHSRGDDHHVVVVKEKKKDRD